MKRREVTFLVSGLIIGIVLGILMQEAGLFGTAGTKSKAVNYYQIPLEDTQEWLVATYPAESEKVLAAMNAFAPSPTTLQIAEAEDTKYLLNQTLAALYGEEDAADLKIDNDSETTLCLGLDDNPYEGSTYYLYLTVPAQVAKSMSISKDWEELDKPKDGNLYWQLLACLPLLEE